MIKIFNFFLFLVCFPNIALSQSHIVYDATGGLGVGGTAISSSSFRHHCTSMGETAIRITDKLFIVALRGQGNADKMVLFKSSDNAATWDSVYAHGNYSNTGFPTTYSASAAYNETDRLLHIFTGTLQDSGTIVSYNPFTDTVVAFNVCPKT